MTDAEALMELAAALHHLNRAEQEAESEKVSEILLTAMSQVDETASEILDEIGKQHRVNEDEDP